MRHRLPTIRGTRRYSWTVWIVRVCFAVQLVPISVSGLGVREASLVMLLPGYGVPMEQALSFSLVIFGMLVFSGLIGGLCEAWDLLMPKKS